MVNFESIKAGTVFRWTYDERPARVLVRDGEVVMYDSWWPEVDAWGHANLGEARRRRINYYVASTSMVLTRANYLRDEPLTEEEEALHRPDLPFSVVSRPDISWPATADELTELFAAGEPDDAALAIPEVYLATFGPKGGIKRPTRVGGNDKTRLSVAELLRKAAELQMPNIREHAIVEGVGIYRLGLCSGSPSFYLCGATDRS